MTKLFAGSLLVVIVCALLASATTNATESALMAGVLIAALLIAFGVMGIAEAAYKYDADRAAREEEERALKEYESEWPDCA